MDKIRIPWPKWKMIRKIGKGGYGTVYEITRNDKFGIVEHAAMKIICFPQDETENRTLLAEGYDKDSITAYNRERLEKVINEYAVMMQMKGHRNIVRCDDCDSVPHEDRMGWDVFIRMELLTSLHTKLEEGALSETEVIKLGKDLSQALMLCEEKNIVHRDIKPENIFVNEYGDYKLGDFGISRTMERTTNATRTGSPRFMAPEVYKDQKYGSAVDIYSLGLVMYWLLNNYRMPFLPVDRPPTLKENEEALQKRMAGEKLPAPSRGSEELKLVVLKACAYRTEERYSTARDFYNALTVVSAKEEVREKETAVEQIPETDETDVVFWKKELDAPQKLTEENAPEQELDETISIVDEKIRNSNKIREENEGVTTPDIDIRWPEPEGYNQNKTAVEQNSGKKQKEKKYLGSLIAGVLLVATLLTGCFFLFRKESSLDLSSFETGDIVSMKLYKIKKSYKNETGSGDGYYLSLCSSSIGDVWIVVDDYTLEYQSSRFLNTQIKGIVREIDRYKPVEIENIETDKCIRLLVNQTN